MKVSEARRLIIGQRRGRINGARVFALMLLAISNVNRTKTKTTVTLI